MLQLLHIENIAVIERADIEFAPGFNALTGETGAGKSIVIDALGAGDAFIASFLVNYADTNGDIAASAKAASAFAAENCGHFGAFGHPWEIEGEI